MAIPPDEVDRLFAEGEALANEGQNEDALSLFQTAWELLSEPREEQKLSVPILAAIADMCFFLRDWDRCRQAVQHAFRCGADLDNPFLRLRLGQSLFELGEPAEAANWMVPVYLTEGRAPFENEDPKYLECFWGRLKPPPGGWPEGW
jgi:hypothetical protein